MIVHILNGDALLQQLQAFEDVSIVARECLIEGPVSNTSESKFWEDRASFLQKEYNTPPMVYFNKTRDEIRKIKSTPDISEFCLWFEFDLFCQTNMWFIINYIITQTNVRKISWAFPDHDNWTGFGSMSGHSLEMAFANRLLLNPSEQHLFSQLWTSYQFGQYKTMLDSKLFDNAKFLRLHQTIIALIELHPEKGLGKAEKMMGKLIEKFPNSKFGDIFKIFSSEAGIYGFGDVQVKKIFVRMTTESQSQQ